MELTENEKKKEFLMSYQKEKRRVRRLEEQLEELRRNKMSPSVTNDGMPHGTDKKDLSDYAVKVDYWDIEALADAMYAIITYPAMHKFLQEEGKKEVDNIKWEYAGQKVRRIYDQVLNK